MSMALTLERPAPCEGLPSGTEFSWANRRRWPRHNRAVRVLMRDAHSGTAGVTINISCGGALLRTAGPLKVGRYYDCSVELTAATHRRATRVIRELPGYVYAVEFEAPIPDPAVDGAPNPR